MAGVRAVGEVVVRNHAGDIRMDSVSGEITASGALQRVTASTVSGHVTVLRAPVGAA